MIKSYKCTQAIKDQHFAYLGKKCLDYITSFKEVLSIIINTITTPTAIEQQIKGCDGNALNAISRLILDKKACPKVNKSILIRELSARTNIKDSYLQCTQEVIDLLLFIEQPKILKSILIGRPRLLELIYYKIEKKFPSLFTAKDIFDPIVNAILSKIFNYSTFKTTSNWNHHALQIKLENHYCLLCNITKLPQTGYSLDHYIPQTKFPIFAVSLFNLIPSCTPCNSNNKNASLFWTDTHLHPYHKDFINDYSFKLEPQSNLFNLRGKNKSYSINYHCSDKKIKPIIDNSFKDLDLLAHYNYARKDIDKSLNIIYDYDAGDIQLRIKMISRSGYTITVEEVYHDLFNRNLDTKKFCEHPHSRLIYDLCRNHGFIEMLESIIP